MWVLPIVSTDTLCLNQNILKENSFLLSAAPSISRLPFLGTVMKGFKLILLFFWNGSSVKYSNLSWSFIFHEQGANTVSDTCTFCRWLWLINWLYDAEIKWWSDDDYEQIKCLCIAFSLLKWHEVRDFTRVNPASAFLPEWKLQLVHIETGRSRGFPANLEEENIRLLQSLWVIESQSLLLQCIESEHPQIVRRKYMGDRT